MTAMTVRELVAELSKFDQETFVAVKLSSESHPHGSMVFVQAVSHVPPWHEPLPGDPPRPPGWVGLCADAGNRITPERVAELRAKYEAMYKGRANAEYRGVLREPPETADCGFVDPPPHVVGG